MRARIHELESISSPEALVNELSGEHGVILLRTGLFDQAGFRYSFVCARPFLTFRSFGSRCVVTDCPDSGLTSGADSRVQFGNPWAVLDALMSRCELLDEIDSPLPLGGCFGFWGYDLKNFVEPKLPRRAANDLDLPDCHVGFYDSLVAFDHQLRKVWVISTGLSGDGSRTEARADRQVKFWTEKLAQSQSQPVSPSSSALRENDGTGESGVNGSMSRNEFVERVTRAQEYIRAGHIYQVNLSHRLTAPWPHSGWDLFQRFHDVSPAPFSAYVDCGDFQIASSSPELFLRLSGPHVQTRPIKGTRPRSVDSTRDAQLAYELQTSMKENSELLMITDLLRNDVGKISEFGSVRVPDLARLERYPHVQHLVSTVEARLRKDVTHFAAFASCFPGGSVTGAPKIRAMEIIDELEPIARGPYTGALGYLGFNRESQLSIVIRSAVVMSDLAHFNVGAGIVADSNPDAEFDETIVKAAGFMAALKRPVIQERGQPCPQEPIQRRGAENLMRKPLIGAYKR